MWLKSKGTLSVDYHQFVQWLRASQFSSSKKKTIEVKGFDDERIKPLSKGTRARPGLVVKELGGGENGQRVVGKAGSKGRGWNEGGVRNCQPQIRKIP